MFPTNILAVGQPVTDLQTWAPVASAALAAIAASASWAAVHQGRRQWRQANQPYLRFQVSRANPAELRIALLNAGTGAGRGIRFCIAVGDAYASGYAGSEYGGVLPPAARIEIAMDAPGAGDGAVAGVAVCHDALGGTHVFTERGGHRLRRASRRARDRTDPEDTYRRVHGKRSLDGLHRVSARVVA